MWLSLGNTVQVGSRGTLTWVGEDGSSQGLAAEVAADTDLGLVSDCENSNAEQSTTTSFPGLETPLQTRPS